MSWPIVFIAPAGSHRRYLRRFTFGKAGDCPGGAGWGHNASVRIEDAPGPCDHTLDWDRRDPRWPVKCDGCDYAFGKRDEWQLSCREVYRSADGAVECTLRDAPVGACWDASWRDDRKGADGRCLYVMLPGRRQWGIDEQASNCTLPGEDTHRCWVRHGRPEDGTLHVDKAGHTCAAGAGSIAVEGYHGFLHHGRLTDPC